MAAETWKWSPSLAKGGVTVLVLGALLDLTSHHPAAAATQLVELQSSSHLVMFAGMALTLAGILAGAWRTKPASTARRRAEDAGRPEV
jgi:hypothetical protein